MTDSNLARPWPFLKDAVNQSSGLVHNRSIFKFYSLHLILVQHTVLEEFVQQAVDRPDGDGVDELLPLGPQSLVCLENKGSSGQENGLTASRVGSKGQPTLALIRRTPLHTVQESCRHTYVSLFPGHCPVCTPGGLRSH